MEGPRFLIVMGTSQSTEGRCRRSREQKRPGPAGHAGFAQRWRVWQDGGLRSKGPGVAGEAELAAVGPYEVDLVSCLRWPCGARLPVRGGSAAPGHRLVEVGGVWKERGLSLAIVVIGLGAVAIGGTNLVSG